MDLALVIAAWVAAAGGILLLAWALLWDRSCGRRRCPKCWYDMAGLDRVRCPECAHEVESPRQLLRTRRRWWGVPAALVLMLGGHLCWYWPDIEKFGAWAAVPTWVLVRIAPMDDRAWTITDWGDWRSKVARNSLLIELARRSKLGSWSRSTWRAYTSRLLANDPLLVSRTFRTRDVWLADSPVVMNVDGNNLLQYWALPSIVTRVRMKRGAESWRVYAFGSGVDWTDGRIEWPAFEEAASADIEAEIWSDDPDRSGSWRIWGGVVRRVRTGTPGDQLMVPVPERELTAGSILFASTELIDLGPERLDLALFAVGHHLGSNASPDWALGARVEVLHRGRVVAEGELAYRMSKKGWLGHGPRVHYQFPLRWLDRPRMQREGKPVADWRVRIIGDQMIAAKDLDRTHYWPGTIEVPIERLMFSGDDPF
jgi:hypothetical protein